MMNNHIIISYEKDIIPSDILHVLVCIMQQ